MAEAAVGVSESDVPEVESENVGCDFDNVYNHLHSALVGDDIDLTHYLEAYKELYNLFVILGGAFQFVATDVKSKIKILSDLQKEDIEKYGINEHFKTIRSMIAYEESSGFLNKKNYVSGCRTLLRLHRGIDFIRNFLQEVYDLSGECKVGPVCREVYDKTLAIHHTWIVKNSARLAMKLLPTREVLLQKMSNNNPEVIANAMASMPTMLSTMKEMYDRVQQIYTDHNLLELP